MDLTALILQLATTYPWLLTAVAVMGSARVIFKGIFAVAQAYVDSTVDTADNEVLVKVEQSKWFKAVSFVLDFTLSIKLPVKKEAVAVVETAAKAA